MLRLDDLLRSGRTAAEVFEHFTQHPGMRQYLRDGELVEYGSHLVAEGGYRMVGEVAMNGMLVAGEAAGLAINSGLTVRGMDLAVGSAVAAADAIAEAVAAGDTSKRGLSGYRRRLDEGFVMRDMRTYARAPAVPGADRHVWSRTASWPPTSCTMRSPSTARRIGT